MNKPKDVLPNHATVARSWSFAVFVCLLTALLLGQTSLARGEEERKTVKLRAWGVPLSTGTTPSEMAELRVLEAFRAKYPWIDPVSTTGITIPGGSKTMDMVPFMQIAGDIAPDTMY